MEINFPAGCMVLVQVNSDCIVSMYREEKESAATNILIENKRYDYFVSNLRGFLLNKLFMNSWEEKNSK